MVVCRGIADGIGKGKGLTRSLMAVGDGGSGGQRPTVSGQSI